MQSQAEMKNAAQYYQEGIEFKEKKQYENALQAFSQAITLWHAELQILEQKTADVADYEKIMHIGKWLSMATCLKNICTLELNQDDSIDAEIKCAALLKRAQAHYAAGNYEAALNDCQSGIALKNDHVAIKQLQQDIIYQHGHPFDIICSGTREWEKNPHLLKKADEVVDKIISNPDIDWKISIWSLIFDKFEENELRLYFEAVKLKERTGPDLIKKLQSAYQDWIENCEVKKHFRLYQTSLKQNNISGAYDAFIAAIEAVSYKDFTKHYTYWISRAGMEGLYSDFRINMVSYIRSVKLNFQFLLEEKKAFFDEVIVKLEPQKQLEGIKQFLKRDKHGPFIPVQHFYWIARSSMLCDIRRGTLALLNAQKIKLEKALGAAASTSSDAYNASVVEQSIFAGRLASDANDNIGDGMEMMLLTKTKK